MVKQASPEAIERLRALADPQRYQQQLSEQRTQYIARAEQLLIERDLTDSDPNLGVEKETVLGQLDTALSSIDFRIGELDESLAAFKTGEQAGMNRKLRRKLLKSSNVAKAAGVAAAVKGHRAARALAIVSTNDEESSGDDDGTGSDDQEEVT